jgi:hypothetical protein
VIEEIKAEDENAKVETKRAVGSRKKQSFGDLSLELAKLHVSYICQLIFANQSIITILIIFG